MFSSSILLILALCIVAPSSVPGIALDETAGLNGIYSIVALEKNGEKQPERNVQGQMVRITPDRIFVADHENKQTIVASYRLNSSKVPWNIMMLSELPQPGQEARGLVKREGDMVWLIYHLPGGETPTEFKTKQKQHMVVLRKLSK